MSELDETICYCGHAADEHNDDRSCDDLWEQADAVMTALAAVLVGRVTEEQQ